VSKAKSAKPASSLSQFHSTRPVAGLTHGFHRYPATTSPELVREVVLAHSSEDDYVLDPVHRRGNNNRRGAGWRPAEQKKTTYGWNPSHVLVANPSTAASPATQLFTITDPRNNVALTNALGRGRPEELVTLGRQLVC
jgi:hypothetical protein